MEIFSVWTVKKSSYFSDACKSPLQFLASFRVLTVMSFSYTEQNFALDVEIQKLGKPHGPRPSNELYSELIMYLVTGRFTVTLIINPWSTKIHFR